MSPGVRTVGAVLAAATLAALVTAPAANANNYASAENGRIAFTTSPGVPGQPLVYYGMYTVSPGGGPTEQVMFRGAQPERPSQPVYSPNGRQLGFGSYKDLQCTQGPGEGGTGGSCTGAFLIQTVALAGGRQRLVGGFDVSTRISSPTDFAPNGRGVLAQLGNHVTYFPIGKGPIRPVSEGFNGSFSPDGRLVVMEAWERRGLDLATSDGRKRFVLTAPGGQARDEHPSFTPSGNRVVFARGDYTTGDYDIYSIRLDGTGLTNLTAGFATRAIEPDVSPNGRAIVFMGRDPDGDHIYRMSSDGSNPTRLHTPDHLLPYQPSWGGSFRCAGKRATIVGDDGRDKIKGTKGNDVIVGNAGPDRIYGRGGKDRICGGDGPDKLLGGKGVDRLVGGPGPDRLRQQGR